MGTSSRELVMQAVIGTTFGDSPEFVVDRAPNGWPAALVPPSPAVTIGGMIAGSFLNAVFRYPETSQHPVAEYCEHLQRNGWTLPKGAWNDGFESTRMVMRCRDSSIVNVALSSPTTRTIMVSVHPCEGYPCEEHPEMRRRAMVVPLLKPAPGVRWDGGSGGGGGGDQTYVHMRAVSDVSPAEMIPFYAKQLADAGWQLGAFTSTADNAMQWVDGKDIDGHPWHGLLGVYVNGNTRELFIYMAKVPRNAPSSR